MAEKYIKDFNSAVSGYVLNCNTTTTSILIKVIDAIASSFNTESFQSTSPLITEFYCHLFELMKTCEMSSPLPWNTINLLKVICKNPGARQILIDQYTFVPVVLRVVNPGLLSDKRTIVLSLLQELTDGIKIEYPEPYLVKLISTLAEWIIKSTNEREIIFLSLSILVNVSKNLAAAYILMKEIDIRKLYRRLMTMDSVNLLTRVQSCRLLVIMDRMNQDLPECAVVEFMSMMMDNFPAAIDTKDLVTVKLFVEFIVEMEANNHFRPGLLEFKDYSRYIKKIISILNSTNPEIVVLIIKLFNALVKLSHPDIIPQHVDIFNLSINWISNEQTVVEALGLFRTILLDQNSNKQELLELINLDSILSIRDTSEDNLLKLTELMKLLLEIAKLPSFYQQVCTKFGDEKMQELLEPLINSSNRWEPEQVRFFIHALALTAELSAKNVQWLTLFNSLIESRAVQMLVATALATRDSEVKRTALMLFSFGHLNKDFDIKVSNCMCELDAIAQINANCRDDNAKIETLMFKCIENAIPFTDKQEIDAIFGKLVDLAKENKIENVEVEQLLEIYEHDKKIAKKESKMYMKSLKNANRRLADLTDLLEQMQENNEKVHQMLFFTQKNEAKWKAKVVEKNHQVTTKEETIDKQKAVIKKQINQLQEAMDSLEKVKKDYAELQKEVDSLLKTQGQLNDKILSLRSSRDEVIEAKNKVNATLKQTADELDKKNEENDELNQEIQKLTLQNKELSETVTEKEDEIKRLESEKKRFETLTLMINSLTNPGQPTSSKE